MISLECIRGIKMILLESERWMRMVYCQYRKRRMPFVSIVGKRNEDHPLKLKMRDEGSPFKSER